MGLTQLGLIAVFILCLSLCRDLGVTAVFKTLGRLIPAFLERWVAYHFMAKILPTGNHLQQVKTNSHVFFTRLHQCRITLIGQAHNVGNVIRKTKKPRGRKSKNGMGTGVHHCIGMGMEVENVTMDMAPILREMCLNETGLPD